jgi:ADP-ribose pyrophosphatase YjhB (NUDIX family)
MSEDNIPTHVVAVTSIVQKGDKFLIAKRASSDPQAGGEWSFPGGKVETENGPRIIEEALKREVAEETGITIGPKVDLIYNDGFVRVSGHHVVMLTFLCQYESGTAEPLEDQEEVGWFSLAEFEKMATDLPGYTKSRIEALKTYLKLT